ncbi:MAG TPA: HlyD family type I secretion periplasmic adaptor subunit [Magnetospirillaceae bacterium]|jgi:HlyD family secretion protein
MNVPATRPDTRRRGIGGLTLFGGSRSSLMAEAIPFQDPIDEISAERPPRYLRSIFYIVVVMFIVVITVASIVKVDMVIVGTGRLVTDTPPIMLQPMDLAMIRELRVHAGDTVKKGQILATLDPTFARADLVSLSSQQRTLLAQEHRLEAELTSDSYTLPASPNSDDLLQQSLYNQRHDQYNSQLRVYDEDIQLRRATLRTTQDDLSSAVKQLEVAKDVETMRTTLMQSQIGSKLQFLEAKTNRMRIEQEQQDATNKLVELQHELQSKEAERQSFVDQWRHQILENLVDTRTQLAKVDEGETKASRMNDLVVVTAPTDGVVLDVANRSPGSVLRQAEPLVTMIPSDAKLVAEISIDSGDVGYTTAGDEVVVKVDAFPYQRHGLLPGKLLSIGEESFPGQGSGPDTGIPLRNKDGGAFHRARVELLSTKLEHLPEGARLIPGMTLTADIKVGTRRAISFFLFPITRALNESIREP